VVAVPMMYWPPSLPLSALGGCGAEAQGSGGGEGEGGLEELALVHGGSPCAERYGYETP